MPKSKRISSPRNHQRRSVPSTLGAVPEVPLSTILDGLKESSNHDSFRQGSLYGGDDNSAIDGGNSEVAVHIDQSLVSPKKESLSPRQGACFVRKTPASGRRRRPQQSSEGRPSDGPSLTELLHKLPLED